MKTTKTKDLVKGVFYKLTNDYWPDGGMVVKMVKHVPAKETVLGGKGFAAIVKSDDGREFAVCPCAYLFDCE